MPRVLMLMPVAMAAILVVLAINEEISRRRARRRLPPPMILPSAEETAASIEAFHAAVRRFKNAEFAWEREKIKALSGKINR